jgi:hypothetical protein
MREQREERCHVVAISSFLRGFTAICIATLAAVGSARAADIQRISGRDGVEIIKVDGRLEDGDFARFKQVAESVKDATLILNSPGGLVREGLQIGSMAKAKGFSTSVPKGATCASACGFIWLAGKKKSVSDGARVGFHAAYLADEDQSISSTGNALVGAYLAKLGYEDLVVIYVTEAAPREMRWLNVKDSKFLGLKVSWGATTPVPSAAPILTREEVRTALLQDDYFSVMVRRFPEFFEFFVSSLMDAERSGEYFEAALTRAVQASPEATEYIDRLLKEAPDDVVIEHSLANARMLRHLVKTDPLMCAAIAFPGEFKLDADSYIQRAEGDLKPFVDHISTLRDQALYASPVQIKPLNKKELSRIKKSIEREMAKAVRSFSRKEMSILMKPVKARKNRDAGVFCRYSIAILEIGLKRPRLIIDMTRYATVLMVP